MLRLSSAFDIHGSDMILGRQLGGASSENSLKDQGVVVGVANIGAIENRKINWLSSNCTGLCDITFSDMHQSDESCPPRRRRSNEWPAATLMVVCGKGT